MPDIITRALLESKGIPTRDIVAAIWGRKLSGGYEPAEATGTLPLTFRSNGASLLDYRIYGNTVETQGVGVRTENLFDPNAAETSGNNIISDFMSLDPSELVLTMAFDIPLRASYNYEITYYDSTKTAISFVGGMGEAYKTREAVKFNWQSEAPNAAYVKVTLPKDLTNVLIQNGSTDGAYIPYGYKMPMVSRTANLFDDNAPDYESGCFYDQNNTKINNHVYAESGYIPVKAGTYLIVVLTTGSGRVLIANFFDTNKNFDSNLLYRIGPGHKNTLTIPSDGYVRFNVFIGTLYVNTFMFIEGSTAPDSYIPYHRTETPIYIGDTQLMQDEYVSYSEQKIYKKVNGTLTPQNPPVPLPELPTFSDADTVLDYEETPAPEEAWVKYKKGD